MGNYRESQEERLLLLRVLAPQEVFTQEYTVITSQEWNVGLEITMLFTRAVLL